VDTPGLQFSLGGSSTFISTSSKLDSSGITVNCANGSLGLKICVRPSAGDLKTMKNIIGHQFRMSAGTAIGTLPVKSVDAARS
jgi:hypothetical protein